MIEWTYIQIDKDSPSKELDKYLSLEMCKEVAEGVRMQCGQEYLTEYEPEPRAAQSYTITKEGRKNIPTEDLVIASYLAKLGYLASLSTSHVGCLTILALHHRCNFQDIY